MSGRPRSIPSYRRHRQSNQGIVTLPDGLGGRRDVLLGKYGSATSRAEYVRVVGEWEANGRRPPPNGKGRRDLTVNELLVQFWKHAEQHYRDPAGEPTSELRDYRYTLKPLKALYGHTLAVEFGPLALRAVRQQMIDGGLCRRVVNQRIGRIRRVFKWAASLELIPVVIPQALATVAGLGMGRSAARETEPVGPVADAAVEAVRPFVSRHVQAMIDLQRLTGMRPGEVVQVRACDVDMTGEVWLYRPARHKTGWRGKNRVVALGPRAQAIIAAFTVPDDAEAFLFSPRRCREERYAAIRAGRKSKVQPSQKCRHKAKPTKRPREAYTAHAYCQAIAAASEAAGVPRWSPNQLRHAHATTIRQRYGLEAAQVTLGHSRADVTQLYAERNLSLAVRVAREIG